MNTNNLGICVTCNDVDICVRRKNHNLAVWYCNEFDDFTPNPLRKNGNSNAINLNFNFQYSNQENPGFNGLCVNCEKRENCLYPKPEGGIWHCNEYV